MKRTFTFFQLLRHLISHNRTVLVVTVSFITSTFAQAAPLVGKVYSVEGTAFLKSGGTGVPIAVQTGAEIFAGDEVSVDELGRVAVRLESGAYLRLSRGSTVHFPESSDKIQVDEGDLHYLSHAESRPTIATPHVTAAIRGTEFIISNRLAETTISMLDGALVGTSDSGSVTLRGGEGAKFKPGVTPSVFKILSSAEAAQWTVYVPLFDSPTDYFPDAPHQIEYADQLDYLDNLQRTPAISDEMKMVARALRVAQRNGPRAALKDLESLPASGCSLGQVVRARLLVASGDDTLGRARLEACSSEQGAAGALANASLAISDFVSAKFDRAKALAEKGLSLHSNSRASALVLSFVLQSQGDLAGALAALPPDSDDDSVTRTRRAELKFAQGDVEKARELLEGLKQRSWYAETILGYVFLADRDREGAEKSFEKAIEMEPSSGLARAGLGLVRMGEGRLTEAQVEFEKSVHLEPLRASFRSYLAKAYFEDDRSDVALKEFQQAITFDPRDPTPHLYRSFVNLAENRPVAALDDLNNAFRLGEKRSVYRSDFLLDQDDAVRSASLARVYRDLGFFDLGRIEAIRAISTDYTNAGAHRLLAESQDTVFLADSALSERRISDLFAPLSVNVADSIGSDVSLNEYSSLFERDGARTGIGTFYDSNHDRFSTGVLSLYKLDNAVFGATATGAIGDGLSGDPSQADGRFGFTLQGQPTWSDRYLVELRGAVQDFEQDGADTDFMTGSVDVAYLHRFSPHVRAVLQSRYEREKRDDRIDAQQTSILSTQLFEGDTNTQEVLASLGSRGDRYITEVRNEAQLVVDSGPLNSIVSFTNTNADVNEYDNSVLLEEELGELTDLGIGLNSTGFTELTSTTIGYLGDYEVVKNVHLNFGGEFSSVQWASRDVAPYADETESDTLWSPKGGIVFTPSRDLMLRIGYAESQGKGRFGDFVTIAPTLVGGMNLKFNDLPGTHARTFGMGIDGRPLSDTYIGAEWTRRWLREPSTPGIYEVTVDFDQDEIRGDTVLGERSNTQVDQHFARAYAFQVLTQEWVIGGDYRLARQSIDYSVDDTYVQDQRGSLFSRYFWDNGFFATTSATYRYQDRENSFVAPNGSDAGWIFSLGSGYRIPNRRGLIVLELTNLFSEKLFLDDTAQFEATVPNDLALRLAAQVNF